MINDQSIWYTVCLALAFTTTCTKRQAFNQSIVDLFQARNPKSHLVKGRRDGFIGYYNNLAASLDPTDFGILSVIQVGYWAMG